MFVLLQICFWLWLFLFVGLNYLFLWLPDSYCSLKPRRLQANSSLSKNFVLKMDIFFSFVRLGGGSFLWNEKGLFLGVWMVLGVQIKFGLEQFVDLIIRNFSRIGLYDFSRKFKALAFILHELILYNHSTINNIFNIKWDKESTLSMSNPDNLNYCI